MIQVLNDRLLLSSVYMVCSVLSIHDSCGSHPYNEPQGGPTRCCTITYMMIRTNIYILSFYSRSPGEEKDDAHISNSAPEIRDVFGDSDDEEPAEYTIQNNVGEDSNVRFRCQKIMLGFWNFCC